MARGKKGFDPSKYTEVKDRLKWYKEDNPDYRIVTEVVTTTDNLSDVIVKAYIYKNAEDQEKGLVHATGLAEELRDAGFINATSHVENCETSAIGRALANLDYHGSDKRPSKEEMDKVQRTKQAKEKPKEKPKPESKSEPKGDDDYMDKIESFDAVEDLVAWFNEELDARKGDEHKEFQEQYVEAVRKKAAELY